MIDGFQEFPEVQSMYAKTCAEIFLEFLICASVEECHGRADDFAVFIDEDGSA